MEERSVGKQLVEQEGSLFYLCACIPLAPLHANEYQSKSELC